MGSYTYITVVLLASVAICATACGNGFLDAAYSADVDTAQPVDTGTMTPIDTGVDTGTATDTDTDTVPITMGFEAEDYDILDNNGIEHAWYVVTEDAVPEVVPDRDTSHAATASGGAYVEALPDITNSEYDTANGDSIADPSISCLIGYYVDFPRAGTYYVWVLGSTEAGDDNSVHVGIDRTWETSGLRMQFLNGHAEWHWSCNQRDSGGRVLGIPNTIYLEVTEPGEHVVYFAMREDGFEMDRWMLSTDVTFRPGPVMGEDVEN